MSVPVLETRGLVRRFGGLVATDEVSLKVEPGARHALIGPNGAGKTTLINLLTGFLPTSGGRILLQGEDITGVPEHARVDRGLVRTFQINQLFPKLTPLQSLAFAVCQRRGAGRRWWKPLGSDPALARRCDQLLNEYQLTEVMNQPTALLPYGKRRLLEIALAIAGEPRVLLLDEPAAGVPEGSRHEIFDSLARLPGDVAVLLIEHDMDLVFSFATHVTVLVNGAVYADGSVREIADDPRVKAVYLGQGHG